MTLKDHSTLQATTATPPITAVKASLFTLVIFVENQARKAFFDSLVDTIMPYFPCRVIAIIAGKESPLNCEHTTKTVRLGKKAILCDIFTITSSYSELAQVPFTLLPLLRPDLPIHLLWAEDLSATPAIFSELKKISSRLIFDSMATPDLFEFARSFINRENTFPDHIIDLTWARLSGWRHIMAETFNSAQKIDQLKNTHKIDLVYNDRTTDHFTHPEYTSFQFIAWLASQLNWTFQSKTDKIMVFKRKNKEIKPRFRQ